MNEFFSYTGLMMIVFTFGMETGFFKFYNDSKTPEEKLIVYSTSFWILLITTIFFTLIGCFFSSHIASAIEYPDKHFIVIILFLILGFDTITTIPFAYLRQQNRPIKFVTIRLINIGINIFFTVFFLWICPILSKNPESVIHLIYKREWGLYYVFLVNLVASATTLLFLFGEIMQVKKQLDYELLKQMLKYSAPLILVGTAGIINDTFDRIMIKNLSIGSLDYRNEQVGLYSAGVKVAVVITMFIQAFRMGAEPYFFKNSKQENARETYAKIMDIFVVMVCFIFLINCLFIDVWKILIAPSYYAGLIVVPVASLGRIFLGIYYNQSIWYKNTKQTMLGASIAIGGATMTVFLSYLLIPKVGFVGAAISSTVVYFLMMLVSYFLGQKHYPVPYNKLKIASILCWTLLMFVLFTIIKTMATKIYNYESIALNIGLASLLICFYGLVISQMHFKEFTKKLILRIK